MILHNNFHNTTVQVNLRGSTHMSRSQVRRAIKKLCGISTCQCGGIRGPQRNGNMSIELTPRADGGYDVSMVDE